MLKRYLEFASAGRVIALSFIVTVAVSFGVFANLPNLEGLMIDLQFGYDAAWINAFLEEIGPEGRATYRWAGGIVDMLFPFAYVTFFSGVLYRYRLGENMWWVAVLPILAGVVDWGENIQIQLMINAFPAVEADQANIANLFTQTKWILVRSIYALTTLSFIVFLVRKYRKAP